MQDNAAVMPQLPLAKNLWKRLHLAPSWRSLQPSRLTDAGKLLGGRRDCHWVIRDSAPTERRGKIARSSKLNG